MQSKYISPGSTRTYPHAVVRPSHVRLCGWWVLAMLESGAISDVSEAMRIQSRPPSLAAPGRAPALT